MITINNHNNNNSLLLPYIRAVITHVIHAITTLGSILSNIIKIYMILFYSKKKLNIIINIIIITKTIININ